MGHKDRAKRREDSAPTTESWAQLLDLNGDVEAVAFVVMMEAAKSAQEDLKSIMDGVKAINAAKRHQRELIAQINRDVVAATVAEVEGREIEFSPQGCGGRAGYERTKVAIADPEEPGGVRFAQVALIDVEITSSRQLAAAKDALQGDLDSMSELGELESLRLQMAMDRWSKMMTTLSNIMKKSSDTGDAIIHNMK